MEATSTLFLAQIAIPNALQCLRFAAPFLAAWAFWVLIQRMDQIIDFLFPHWKWEQQLGWLDIKSERRVETFFRWLGYFVYALLAVALYGIVWGAQALADLDRADDPAVAVELVLHVPVLFVCTGFWLVYLGLSLLPRLRNEYEKDELDRFRIEQREIELERERNPASRVKSPLPKPRFNRLVRSDWRGPGQ